MLNLVSKNVANFIWLFNAASNKNLLILVGINAFCYFHFSQFFFKWTKHWLIKGLSDSFSSRYRRKNSNPLKDFTFPNFICQFQQFRYLLIEPLSELFSVSGFFFKTRAICQNEKDFSFSSDARKIREETDVLSTTEHFH